MNNKIPAPEAPCAACFQKAAFSNNILLFAYCEHRQVGSYAVIKGGGFSQWQTISPITETAFNDFLKNLIIESMRLVNTTLNELEKRSPGGEA